MDDRTPRSALLLGYAGLLPAVLLLVLAVPEQWPGAQGYGHMLRLAGFGYAGVILSFLGGMWWGGVSARPEARPFGLALGLAVVPALLAFATLGAFDAAPAAGVILAAALLLTLPVDAWLARGGTFPPWWMRLRVPLSGILALLTLAQALVPIVLA
jgi:hypothetical protein